MIRSNYNGAREVWVDWLRVTACFLVMMVHSSEPFYLGGEGTLILTASDTFWASFFDSFARACVPLFLVASSYLQFPLHYSTGEFLRRRAGRILVPFAIWTVAYALVWGEGWQSFKCLLLNFNYIAGHLWFVYMLLGIYLIMPLLSPWAEKVGKKELLFYLSLCFLTSFIPYIREYAIGESAVYVFSADGIPMPAHYPLWGEACWNETGIFYYLSGYLGYLLLGLYLRRFGKESSGIKSLSIAICSWLCGFILCFSGFITRVFSTCNGSFPVGGDCAVAGGWETPWSYNGTGVFLMTLGWILLFRRIGSSGWFYNRVVLPVSKASYGMYLCHIFVLAYFSGLFRSSFGIGSEGSLGIFTTAIQIPLTAICTYICVAVFSVLIQRIPKIGKLIA
ncbi:MAG: acyltransferase [Bacteroidales bacterium]|nr:acyltransferase [Candidatus Egerieousia equi]